MEPLPAARDKLLFTPGPLTTSLSVKQAMLHDAGSWHHEFNAKVKWIRERLLEIAGVTRVAGWEVVLLQGSGTFGVESVFATAIPREGKVGVLANGAYGERMVQMLQRLGIPHAVFRTPENVPPEPAAVRSWLESDRAMTHVAVVHCETTTGILNPILELGRIVKEQGRTVIVDAMSSFGGMPIDFEASGIDFLVSSANKCLEGVPGFSFVFCRREVLLATEGCARSLSLDLLAQWRGFESNGQFRYTPPTHALLAFEVALQELAQEGGVVVRAARYQRNHEVLLDGMKRLGFRPFLDPAVQSHLITSFYYPADSKFSFSAFYEQLSERGFIIYPGKISQAATFRIGTIGRIFETDIRALLAAIGEATTELGLRGSV